MTKEQAYSEAKSRWTNPWISYEIDRAAGTEMSPFSVGYLTPGCVAPTVMGTGNSWEAAFAHANATPGEETHALTPAEKRARTMADKKILQELWDETEIFLEMNRIE